MRVMLLVFSGSCAFAQATDPYVGDLQQFYAVRKGDLLKAADRMPAADYDFRPVPEVRTFAQLLAHIIDAQAGFCSAVKGNPRPPSVASKTSKDELVAALKASFALCDNAFGSIGGGGAQDALKSGNTQRSKFYTLLYATLHDNEEYGYLAMYLRLKGLVPPSTDSR
jgi:DinB superfamily